MGFSVGQSFCLKCVRSCNPRPKTHVLKPRDDDLPGMPPKTAFPVMFASVSTMRKTIISRIVGITITLTAYKPHKYVVLSVNRELSENILL